MLARYTIHRGKRPAGHALPEGVRQDIRAHTSHCLRAPRDAVREYLADPDDAGWKRFAKIYRDSLAQRRRDDRAPFDTLAALARDEEVHIGCSCPTKQNPDVRRCHTMLALKFMQSNYPDLDVAYPPAKTR